MLSQESQIHRHCQVKDLSILCWLILSQESQIHRHYQVKDLNIVISRILNPWAWPGQRSQEPQIHWHCQVKDLMIVISRILKSTGMFRLNISLTRFLSLESQIHRHCQVNNLNISCWYHKVHDLKKLNLLSRSGKVSQNMKSPQFLKAALHME